MLLKLTLLAFTFGLNQNVLATTETCQENKVLINSICWSLKDQKFDLSQKTSLEELCDGGLRLPTMDEYLAVEKEGKWSLLNHSKSSQYLTSTKNSSGEVFFVNNSDAYNGFFRALSGSGSVNYRCLAPATALTLEEEVVDALNEVLDAVNKKADSDIKKAYARGGNDTNSVEYANILKEVKVINTVRNQLINLLAMETKDFFDLLLSRAESDINGTLDKAISGALQLYDSMREGSNKALLGDQAVDRIINAHGHSSIDIIPEKNKSEIASASENEKNQKLSIPDIKKELGQGEMMQLVSDLKNVTIQLNEGTLNSSLLLSGSGNGGVASSLEVPKENAAFTIVPAMDLSMVTKVNEIRKKEGREPIKLVGGDVTSHKATSSFNASIPDSSNLSSLNVGGKEAMAPANESATGAFRTKPSTVSTVTKDKKANSSVVVNPSSFKVERPGYLLESIHKQLLSKANQDNAFEIVQELKKLEDKISYKITNVSAAPLSTKEKRLDETEVYGLSIKSLFYHAHSLVGAYNELYKIQKEIDSYSDLLKTTELKYDKDSPTWRSANHIMKSQREQRYQVEKGQLMERKRKSILALSSQRLIVFKRSEGLLSDLFRLAVNPCPQGLTLNQSWQSLGAKITDVRRYICEGQDKKGYSLQFDKLPKMDHHDTKENGIVDLGMPTLDPNVDISKRDYSCPETFKTPIFGKMSEVQFDSVVYHFDAETKADPRFYAKGTVPSFTSSKYRTRSISNRLRKDSCIPHESGLSYSIPDSSGKPAYSSNFSICEGKTIIVNEQIQNDRISTTWKIKKTTGISCSYKFQYEP